MDETAVAKMFEEVKVMFGELPERMQHFIREGVVPNVPRRRLNIEMAERLLLRDMPGLPMPWLVFVSSFRDTLPWLYDAGMELYRAMTGKSPLEIRRAQESLRDFIRYMQDSPAISILLESGFLPRKEYQHYRRLLSLLDHYLSFPFENVGAPARRKSGKQKRDE